MENLKKISEKQFKNAVKTVLNGGKSKIASTKEVKPFYWVRSKGRMSLKGSIPEHSKFLRNDGERNGADKDVYLVACLNPGYSIEPTKAEVLKSQRLAKEEARLKKSKRKQEAKRLADKAKELGFPSVAAMKRKQKEIDAINRDRFNRARQEQIEIFEKQEGRPYEEHKIVDRVKLSRIELNFERLDDII